MSRWDTIFTAVANLIVGKTVNRAELLFLASKQPGYVAGSQGPTDYRGIRDANGKIQRNPSQAVQYRPILFVGTGDSYTGLPVSERISKPGMGRGTSVMSDADMLASLIAKGIVKAPKAPTNGATIPAPTVSAPTVPASK